MAERRIGGVTRLLVGAGLLGEVFDGSDPMAAILEQPGAVGVADAIAAVAPSSVVRRVMPDRDAAKTLATVEETVAWLADSGVRRDGVIVGVGGGALLDAAGFIASVYLRGVTARYVPTTLLGAVDAAIGGKTGINVAGKNLVGTFRHPERVVVDLDVLAANPPELLAEGLAEAIKAGLIGDPALFGEIERHGRDADLAVVVEGAIEVKAGVVDQDFTETGRRAILNFGHTIGHAVEFLSGWSHGRSVAVGMAAAAAASERVAGFTDTARILGALERAGLPTAAPELDPQEVLVLVSRDKKADAEGIRMVLLEGIGQPVVSYVDSATLGAALAAVGIGDR